jgi:hypothetical protein
MLLASPYASRRCIMANCELRVGKGGLLIIMPHRSAVNYRFSRKNCNIVMSPPPRAVVCALLARQTVFFYPHTPWWLGVHSSIHCYDPLLTSAFSMQPPLFAFISLHLRHVMVLGGLYALLCSPPLTLVPQTSVAPHSGI